MISLWKYILLGIIQGITEILPISSSAHLVVMQELLFKQNNEDIVLEVVLHFASLIAVIVFLRKRLLVMIKESINYLFHKKNADNHDKKEFFLALYLMISIIPLIVFTLLFDKLINQVFLNIRLIGLLLIVNAFIIFWFSRRKTNENRLQSDIKIGDALTIGLSQCIGVFPGISRSGSCLLGASICKIKKTDAAEYAFLMFIPVTIGAVVKTFLEIPISSFAFNDLGLLAAFIVCIPTTFIALRYLLILINKGKTMIFSLYCVLLGIILVLFS